MLSMHDIYLQWRPLFKIYPFSITIFLIIFFDQGSPNTQNLKRIKKKLSFLGIDVKSRIIRQCKLYLEDFSRGDIRSLLKELNKCYFMLEIVYAE